MARILHVAGVVLSIADPRAERNRQAAELFDALSLVDAMPARPRRTGDLPSFKELISA